MDLKRIAAIVSEHSKDAANIAQYGAAFASRTLSGEEHALISELAKAYLSVVQREGFLRDEIATAAMQGLLAGMSADPGAIISGPQIAGTAYDIAACMMDERAKVKT